MTTKKLFGDLYVDFTYLAKISLSSCSDTNCPKLATNKVEHGALADIGWLGGWLLTPFEPTGLAKNIIKFTMLSKSYIMV